MKTPKLELTDEDAVMEAGVNGLENYIPTINGSRRGLQEEGGITRVSLDNLEYAIKRLGKPVRLTLVEWGAVITLERGALLATGFATGYRGEGPSGLAKVLVAHTDLAKDFEEAQKIVSNWTSAARGLVWRVSYKA
jgi:hypothetical protein